MFKAPLTVRWTSLASVLFTSATSSSHVRAGRKGKITSQKERVTDGFHPPVSRVTSTPTAERVSCHPWVLMTPSISSLDRRYQWPRERRSLWRQVLQTQYVHVYVHLLSSTSSVGHNHVPNVEATKCGGGERSWPPQMCRGCLDRHGRGPIPLPPPPRRNMHSAIPSPFEERMKTAAECPHCAIHSSHVRSWLSILTHNRARHQPVYENLHAVSRVTWPVVSRKGPNNTIRSINAPSFFEPNLRRRA
ncbi:hypothetical protein EDB87DRAFT_572405 [Lactarius vividus]|nr:hypothetical protein EDB87DRAFT_572405 [Lactarius vividus]